MEANVTKRITILVDDTVREALLEQAGSERKMSEVANRLLAEGLRLQQPPDFLKRLAELEEQIQVLRKQIAPGRESDA